MNPPNIGQPRYLAFTGIYLRSRDKITFEGRVPLEKAQNQPKTNLSVINLKCDVASEY